MRGAGAALWRVELHLAGRLPCVGAVVAGQAAGRLQVRLEAKAAVLRAPPQVVCKSTNEPKSPACFRVLVLKVDHRGLGFRVVVLSVD